MNKKVFKIIEENGQEKELCIKKPTAEIRIRSQLVFNRNFREAIEAGSILRKNIENEAEKLGLWNDEKRQQIEDLQNQHRSLERKLRGGANSFDTKEEACKCALEMRKLRFKIMEISRSRDELYSTTAEAYADEARTKYFVSQCCIDNNTGKPYFKSYEDYLSQSESEIGREAMASYFNLIVDDMGDIEGEWFEVKWLREHKYMDDKNRFINSNGELTDENGRRVNDKGYYINDNNEPIDVEGNPLTEDGIFKVEYKSWE